MSGKEIEDSNALPQTFFSCLLESDGLEWATSSALDFASSAIVGALVSIHISWGFESFISMKGAAVDAICTFSKGSLRLIDSSVPMFEGITCFESRKSFNSKINMKAKQEKNRMSINLRELAATYSGPPEGT